MSYKFMEPLVSVIVPVYNSAKFLNKAIGSIVAQTYENLEIILIDDGSTDNSLDICREHALKDSRIKVFNQNNGGPSVARNMGLDKCNGELLTFQDSDDFVAPDRIETLMTAYFKCNADLIIGNITTVTKYGKKSFEKVDEKFYNCREQILNDKLLIDHPNFPSPCNKLYKMAIIKEHNLYFDPEMKIGEDWEFNVRYLNFVNSLLFIPDSVYFYQKGNSYLTKQFRSNDYDTRKKLIKSIEQLYANNNVFIDTGTKYIRLALSCIMRLSHKKNNMTYRERIEYVRNLKNDDDLIRSLQNKQNTFIEKINARVLRIKSPTIIYFISKFYWFAWKLNQH